MRRENLLLFLTCRLAIGSSPRAQGKRRPCALGPEPRRFIPTCAGKTNFFHRGECRSRFIPTCAGKTHVTWVHRRHLAVHPHVRRENIECALEPLRLGGSSPRAQGKRVPLRNSCQSTRFIPTCAGKTSPDAVFFSPFTVHPHVRRENFSCAVKVSIDRGSSPRAQGKLPRVACWVGFDRFIPTCAGKTPIGASCLPSVTVHPHVRRENASDKKISVKSPGSSPRAQGKLLNHTT